MTQCSDITVKGLRPFQYDGIEYMLATKRSINAASRGLGKSVMAIAAVDTANLYPAVIVCPASVSMQWAGEVLYWLKGKRSVSILQGKKKIPIGESLIITVRDRGRVSIPVNDLSADIVIVNYSIVWNWAQAIAMRGNHVLVLDEVHRCKDAKTYQHKACNFLAENLVKINQSQYIFGLSGTPIVNRPADLIGILKILGKLALFGGWMGYTKRFCALQQKEIVFRSGMKKVVYDYTGASNLDELHMRLKVACMWSKSKQEALPDLPPKQKIPVPVALSNSREYAAAEANLLAYLKETALRDEKFNASLRRMPYEELCAKMEPTLLEEIQFISQQEQVKKMRQILREEWARSKTKTAERAQALVRLGVLRHLSGMGKVAIAIEWIKDFIVDSPDEKLLVFAHHRDVQEAILAKIPEAISIMGGQSTADRDRVKQLFQAKKGPRIAVISMEAGGEGLDLTAAYNSVILELPNTAKTLDQVLDRAYGRLVDPHGLTAWFFLASNTIDDDLMDLIEKKMEIASQIVDGVASEGVITGDLLGALLTKLTKRALATRGNYQSVNSLDDPFFD